MVYSMILQVEQPCQTGGLFDPNYTKLTILQVIKLCLSGFFFPCPCHTYNLWYCFGPVRQEEALILIIGCCFSSHVVAFIETATVKLSDGRLCLWGPYKEQERTGFKYFTATCGAWGSSAGSCAQLSSSSVNFGCFGCEEEVCAAPLDDCFKLLSIGLPFHEKDLFMDAPGSMTHKLTVAYAPSPAKCIAPYICFHQLLVSCRTQPFSCNPSHTTFPCTLLSTAYTHAVCVKIATSNDLRPVRPPILTAIARI
jgi:hypothetical protein